MNDLQNLISKITSDIKNAEIGISMLEATYREKAFCPVRWYCGNCPT